MKKLLLRGRARDRLVYVALFFTVVGLGLGARHFRTELPAFVGLYAGDTLWAAMVYFLCAILAHRREPAQLALIALAFSFLIEVSQLYQAPWITAVRDTWPGGLILGHGFLWSDLVCYAAGVALAVMVDLVWISKRSAVGP
ncbi:MAG: DUF2809 domain-containing protein [Limisphaerales bacterium]